MTNTNFKLEIFADLMSQPVRSVLSFCNFNNIKYDIVDIQIAKGDNRKADFLKVNPNAKVPAIKITEENGEIFVLSESCAILRYLACRFNVSENWYNQKDLKRQALINQYLDWHHGNTRMFCGGTAYAELVIPLLKSKGLKYLHVTSYKDYLPKFIDDLDKKLSKTKYIIDKNISIADLMLYHELIQLYLLNFDFSAYKAVDQYIKHLSSMKEIEVVNNIIRLYTKKLGVTPKF